MLSSSSALLVALVDLSSRRVTPSVLLPSPRVVRPTCQPRRGRRKRSKEGACFFSHPPILSHAVTCWFSFFGHPLDAPSTQPTLDAMPTHHTLKFSLPSPPTHAHSQGRRASAFVSNFPSPPPHASVASPRPEPSSLPTPVFHHHYHHSHAHHHHHDGPTTPQPGGG